MLIFLCGTGASWKEMKAVRTGAVRPGGLCTILTKSDKLGRHDKTREKGVWARGGKL